MPAAANGSGRNVREGNNACCEFRVRRPVRFGLCGRPANAEPVKIRNSWVAPVSNWASILLEKKDLAKHLGQSYVMEPVHFGGTPPMITALANNELEISNLAYSTLGIAIENAGLSDLRIVSDEFQDGVNGYYSQEFMVLADGPIKKVEDLKGKVIATNAAGSAIDIAMRAMLHKHGLEDKRDYTMVEAPFPAMKAMLAEHKVDLIPAVVPFSYDPELRKIARDLFVQKDAIGVTDMIVWTARKPFIDKNRAALVDFFEDTLRITRWYLDPKNHSEVDGNRRARDQAAAAELRLGVHQEGLLSRSRHAAEPRRAAEERRPDSRSGLHQVELRRQTYSDLSMVKEAAKRLQ